VLDEKLLAGAIHQITVKVCGKLWHIRVVKKARRTIDIAKRCLVVFVLPGVRTQAFIASLMLWQGLAVYNKCSNILKGDPACSNICGYHIYRFSPIKPIRKRATKVSPLQ
tara:strand:+ start:836 stop:1165 length:330 start_codon:yes stop_codon:yes gene_type:complete